MIHLNSTEQELSCYLSKFEEFHRLQKSTDKAYISLCVDGYIFLIFRELDALCLALGYQLLNDSYSDVIWPFMSRLAQAIKSVSGKKVSGI